MTTLAKLDANRRNAQRSTGPRTAEGKAAAARNATTHGIFAAVPVLPGERADAWDVHRAGVVASLAPVGLLEINLAERAALLLWRLQRLARYEAETVAGTLEDAGVPPLPSDDPFPVTRDHPTRDGQLRDLRRELREAKQELAEVAPALTFWTDGGGAEVGSFAVAETILDAAYGRAVAAEGLKSDPPEFGGKAFLRKLGLGGTAPAPVAWTRELIGRGLMLYAEFAHEPTERFGAAVREDVEIWAEELERKVRRLESECVAVARLLDTRVERKRVAKLLPGDGRDERIAKYERHLHGLLTSTLHELERLQARRGGQSVPPPVVADLNVSVEGPG
ncbi:hypothetical protein GobsT_26180 [Gemmata obscuriglobus]|uniref:Uncharacterized protein n=1 Tax=Gemmata obscuriglobus TaxID=114 RepID=A0A2Z3H6B3_9BACT|nr:hypothetical protein [Gemmata obscuriglobus]AWM39106.1 hypothetical protein C1280_20375 [Gemmata obscuriglobus]QEG27854.1 hypothetical protein GobsT_26180 [Gemmata obscuriglobus]VTS05234.1 Uncharacterized protein OS=Rubrobacter xylanophilus (strain DSM 9941 / NBRC 16129) GN=Rxyl_1596 PE=4 SV=1 [Gemmata obscuriglobus UQM 2246]